MKQIDVTWVHENPQMDSVSTSTHSPCAGTIRETGEIIINIMKSIGGKKPTNKSTHCDTALL